MVESIHKVSSIFNYLAGNRESFATLFFLFFATKKEMQVEKNECSLN